MTKILLINALCIVVALTTQNYTLFKEIEVPKNQQKISFSNDFINAFLYDESTNTVTSYQAYDWSNAQNPKQLNLTIQPNSLQFCEDAQYLTSFVYGDSQGLVYKAGVQEAGKVQFWLEKLSANLTKVYPSSDSSLFAAFQKGKSQVYISNLTKGSTNITVLDFEQNQINSIRWVPGKLQLAIVGGNTNKKTSIFRIYYIIQQIEFDFTKLTTQILADIEFSSDGNKIYGLYASPKNDVLIPIFDISQISLVANLSAQSASSLSQLRRSGNFLTAFNSEKAYVWNLVNEDFYGEYQSILKSSGLSADGSDLVTMTSESKIQIFKLCNDLKHFYDSTANTCLPCKSPCLNCFSQEDKCSSCISKFFFDTPFKCIPCLNNCQTCQNAKTCDKCLKGYYYQENQCNSCFQSIVGCIQCQTKDKCNLCDTTNNWEMNFSFKCICTSGYVQVGKICQACPLHCDTCIDVNTCKSCRVNQHWAPVPNAKGKCICDRGYFQQNDACKDCILGCNTCTNSQTCQSCDADHFWQLQNGKCVCPEDRTQVNLQCSSCSSLMTGCLKCSSKSSCTQCIQDYTLNPQTNQCQENAGTNVIIIVIVAVAAAAALGVGVYFVWRLIKKRRAQKIMTLIQSEGGQQYEKVDN